MQTKSKSNKIFYIIQGYPGSGKTSCHYKLQKAHCDKQMNHMFYEDSITEFIEEGMNPLKAKYLVDQLTESNIFTNPDIYVLEDVRLQSDRRKYAQVAETQGYQVVIINFTKPKLIENKLYSEYVKWLGKTKSKFPKDPNIAISKLRQFDIMFEPLTKDEKENYKVINVPSFIDSFIETQTIN